MQYQTTSSEITNRITITVWVAGQQKPVIISKYMSWTSRAERLSWAKERVTTCFRDGINVKGETADEVVMYPPHKIEKAIIRDG